MTTKKFIKSEFYKNKKVTKIVDTDVTKILVSKEEPYEAKNSFKYFIGYNGNDVIRPLCIKLLQMTGYAKKLLKIKFDSKPLYGDDKEYIKTKTKKYGDSVITNFIIKKIPREKTPCKCLSLIVLDFVIKTKKKYYPRTLLKESKYEQERIKIENLNNDDLEESYSDSDSNDETESDIDNDESNE